MHNTTGEWITMLKQLKVYLLVCVVTLTPVIAIAQSNYAPSKVVYDVDSSSETELTHIIDRAAFLQNIYQNDSFDASIILVIHGGAIPLVAKNNKNHHELMERLKSLILGEIIQFRLCEASANVQGFKKDDFDNVIQMVPMADAEIIALQNNGYAYMR